MADAPAAQELVARAKTNIQRLRDRKQDLQAQLQDVNAQIDLEMAIRDNGIAFIAYMAAKP